MTEDVCAQGSQGINLPEILRVAGMPQRLTDIEKQILWGIAKGTSDREVALGLRIHESTVKKHVGSIIKKLGVRTRAEAMTLAFLERTKLENKESK